MFSRKIGQAKPFSQDDPIILRSDSQVRFVPAKEIVYIEAEGNVQPCACRRQTFNVRQTQYGGMGKLLPQPPFLRFHRSFIVNLTAIGEIVPDEHEGAKLVLEGYSMSVMLTRRAYRRLRQAVKDLESLLKSVKTAATSQSSAPSSPLHVTEPSSVETGFSNATCHEKPERHRLQKSAGSASLRGWSQNDLADKTSNSWDGKRLPREGLENRIPDHLDRR